MENLLANISWTTFLTSLTAVLIMYYAYIGYTLYDQELKGLFKPKPNLSHNPFQFKQQEEPHPVESPGSTMEKSDEVPFEETTEDTFERIETLIEELKLGIKTATMNNLSAEQLSLKIASTLAGFPDLKTSPFQPAINEMIHTESKNSGFDTLSEDDVARLWIRVS